MAAPRRGRAGATSGPVEVAQGAAKQGANVNRTRDAKKNWTSEARGRILLPMKTTTSAAKTLARRATIPTRADAQLSFTVLGEVSRAYYRAGSRGEVLESVIFARVALCDGERLDAMIGNLLDAGYVDSTICAKTRKAALRITHAGLRAMAE